jgi:hypothetical protein
MGADNVYRIDRLLSDADLFRRLRLRGVAHGKDGVDDLEAALSLVTGPPFDRQRRNGYSWLVDLPLDYEYTAMIVDVTHLAATHHLATGHPDLAAKAAQVSLLAASHDDIALLDLVAASDAQGTGRPASGSRSSWQTTTPKSKKTYHHAPPRSCTGADGSTNEHRHNRAERPRTRYSDSRARWQDRVQLGNPAG